MPAIPSPASFVEVRLYRSADLTKAHHEIPVASYFPLVLGLELTPLNHQNIEKRIRTIYFQHDATIVKAGWNLPGAPDIYWVIRT